MMKFRKIVVLLLILNILLISGCCKKNIKINKLNSSKVSEEVLKSENNYFIEDEDIEITINQRSINKFLKTFKGLKNKNSFEVLFIKNEYEWTIQDAYIEINEYNAKIFTDIMVKMGEFEYLSKVEGKVDIFYNDSDKKICLKVKDAFLNVYWQIFGNKVTVSNLDISKYYNIQYDFDISKMIEKEMKFGNLDNSNNKKKIKININKSKILLEKEKIKIIFEIDFQEI